MDLQSLILIDRSPSLTRAWKAAFHDVADVEVVLGDYFSRSADAMVSPANSFGIMDGGLDLAIRNELGMHVQRDVQRMIVREYHGEMPVGAAALVPTQQSKWSWLVVAPTMRVPESVARSTNAYVSFRAVLLAVASHNRSASTPIRSLVCSGLGTGVGSMQSERCAVQMRMAWRQVHSPARIPSFKTIHRTHAALIRA